MAREEKFDNFNSKNLEERFLQIMYELSRDNNDLELNN